MDRRRSIVVTVSLLAALTSPLKAQWVQTNGPFGGTVNDMCVSGNKLNAAAANGVFYSTDNGSHWSATLTVDLGGVTALAAGGSSRVWAGASHGVFLSTNDGASWSDVTTPTVNDYVNSIAASPSEVLIAQYGGLFRSTDLGIGWENIGAGLPSTYANALLIDGNDIWVGLQNSPRALYRSSNGGQSWQYSDSGFVRTRQLILLR